MIKVFQLETNSSDYEVLALRDDGDWASLRGCFSGEKMSESWVPLDVEILVEENDQKAKKNDIPSLSPGIPVFTKRAADALGTLLTSNGELLPLGSPVGEYYAFNVTNIIDALNVERSDVKRFGSGKIMRVNKYEFFREKVVGEVIFKIPQLRRSHIFVTDVFLNAVQKMDLHGIVLKEVWRG